MADFMRMCHIAIMTTKTAAKRQRRRTTMVPVTTMEEIPVPDEGERAELLAALKESEARIKAGDYTEYDPKKFKDRLLRIYRRKKR
jgi:hypothetical protein